ncbi:ABC-three component system middle component 2 [Saccharopolyspora sp. NPDC049426]|uniref:ABC-three component system middle component 2 n=1 Tax=Saccharopolyspora sp. NPDC049426 TaxID=3155652 RepID=UPI00341DECB5
MNPLNSPIEVGIRALVLLVECFPDSLDVAQLVYLDHAMVHSGHHDGGPPSLHPELPIGPGELGMRRHLIDQGLAVLMRADLAEMLATERGLVYSATDKATSFLDVFEAPYVGQLRERAAWTTSILEIDEADVRDGMNQITRNWIDGRSVEASGYWKGTAP